MYIYIRKCTWHRNGRLRLRQQHQVPRVWMPVCSTAQHAGAGPYLHVKVRHELSVSLGKLRSACFSRAGLSRHSESGIFGTPRVGNSPKHRISSVCICIAFNIFLHTCVLYMASACCGVIFFVWARITWPQNYSRLHEPKRPVFGTKLVTSLVLWWHDNPQAALFVLQCVDCSTTWIYIWPKQHIFVDTWWCSTTICLFKQYLVCSTIKTWHVWPQYHILSHMITTLCSFQEVSFLVTARL
jgi:hypothetical protein